MLGVIRAEIPKAEVKKLIERRVFYRLVAGRYDDMTSAVRLRSDLLKRNISSIIMQSKNRFSVVVSSHISEKLALDEQKQLVSKHINSSIVKFNLSSAYWQINSVDAYNLRDAVYTATIMATNDVITTIE